MCKVMAITKITDQNRDDCWVFAQLLGEKMTPGNNDGLGYAAFDSKGNLFGEKWLFNQTAFKDLTLIKGFNPDKLDKIYSSFGTIKQNDAQAIILHTRAATCAKGINNTHPFVNDEKDPKVAIIHNGMIYNDEKFTKKYSTCDSEVLAHLYHENDVYKGLTQINTFAPRMQGWYTVLALAKDTEGRMVMDAFTDTGRLGSYFIKELDTRVYSTSGEDVYQVAKTLGLTPLDYRGLPTDYAVRIDVLTGKVLNRIEFDSSSAVPVRINDYDADWNNVVSMYGNLSDEEFRKQYWKRWE